MTDRHQELAVAMEDLRKHLNEARESLTKLEDLNEELQFDPFGELTGVHTDLMITSTTVSQLERNVVAYFSLRAGGRR